MATNWPPQWLLAPPLTLGCTITGRKALSASLLGTCALIIYLLGERSSPLHCGQNPLLLIICHLAGLILLQSDFLAGILFPRKSPS